MRTVLRFFFAIIAALCIFAFILGLEWGSK